MEFKKIQNFFFFGSLGLATLLFFWVSSSLFYIFFWTIFLAIVFYPVYKKLLKLTKNKKNLSSAITILLIIFLIIIPLSLSLYLIVKQIPEINSNLFSEEKINMIIHNIPFSEDIDHVMSKYGLHLDDIETKLINSFRESLKTFGGSIVSFGKNTLNLFIQFFVMMYFLFFTFKDGKKYLLRISEILPLGNKTEKRLFSKFSSIVRSIFKGTLIVSAVQGLLGGILFALVGFEGFFVWTILLTISAMIPAIGTGIIIVPAIILMLATGQTGTAIALALGLLFISSVDNFLRPAIIGHETEMPDILITASIFGGLETFGVTGLIIGPVIAGLFLAMWHIFEEKYKIELNKNE